MEREATKIKRVWRGSKGRQAMREAKQTSFEEEKEWKASVRRVDTPLR